jgi:hypothetical protein
MVIFLFLRNVWATIIPSARVGVVTLLASFEMGRCPLARRQAGSFGIGGGKRIVVADHCAES